MKRLLTTMWWDIRLQLRNGFYYATAFIVVAWVVVRSQLPGLGGADLGVSSGLDHARPRVG